MHTLPPSITCSLAAFSLLQNRVMIYTIRIFLNTLKLSHIVQRRTILSVQMHTVGSWCTLSALAASASLCCTRFCPCSICSVLFLTLHVSCKLYKVIKCHKTHCAFSCMCVFSCRPYPQGLTRSIFGYLCSTIYHRPFTPCINRD